MRFRPSQIFHDQLIVFYITLCLCHLPVSDVYHLVFGHGQWEDGQVATAEDIRDVGAHVLQAGDKCRELMISGAKRMFQQKVGLLAHLVDVYKVF